MTLHGIDQAQADADRETAIILEYLLLGDLRELLQEPSTRQTRHALLVILGALLDELSHDADLDGDDDALSEALYECPNWFREIESVRGDQLTHYLRLEELRQHIEQDAAFDRVGQEVCRNLEEWMKSLSVLRRQGTRLVQMAVNRDHGGEA